MTSSEDIEHAQAVLELAAKKPYGATMHTATIAAPFSDEQIASIRAWQVDRNMHPLTCSKDGCQTALNVRTQGLVCRKCGTTQDWVPAVCAKANGSAVVHPTHYNTGKIEAWDAIYAWGLNFHRGSAVKYIARAGHKGDAAKEIEDLEKARCYLDDEIARLKGDK